eukprot:Seg1695.10 transcript_id=Seg1695.10/GoldUCD/mRNA.D3Y31 product="hypothetical protein" protein_id=Seg1695.10/GoldUCD/D3Y31
MPDFKAKDKAKATALKAKKTVLKGAQAQIGKHNSIVMMIPGDARLIPDKLTNTYQNDILHMLNEPLSPRVLAGALN